MINRNLAEERGLDPTTIATIGVLQHLCDKVVEAAEDDPRLVEELYKNWLAMQRRLQVLWGFEQNDSYIRFWTFPSCSCPVLDNKDSYASGYFIVSEGCPVHSGGAFK
jgi:hypothetical protein